MKIAICHYSFHRTWDAQGWDIIDVARAVKHMGADGIDFHVRFLGEPSDAVKGIRAALEDTGLELSGLSLANNFNHQNIHEQAKEVGAATEWLKAACDINAPVVRIFGGHIVDRTDIESLEEGLERIVDALRRVTAVAEQLGVVLALENHGGLPCTAEEQVWVIEQVGSPCLRATIDVGNYMQGGQEGHVGTSIAAKHAAYVHIKDFSKIADSALPWGWNIRPTTVGQGDVQHARCLGALKMAGYDGFVALEYEGAEHEPDGIAESIEYIRKLLL